MTASLRSRGVRIVAFWVGGFFLVFALLTYVLTRYQIDHIADAQLEENARLVSALAELAPSDETLGTMQDGLASALSHLRKRQSDAGVQVFGHSNTLIAASDNLRALALDAAPAGLATMQIQDEPWRVYTLLGDKGRWVRVGERADGLIDTDRTLLATALSSLVVVPILALVMRWAVTVSVRPLSRLAEQLSHWRPHQPEPIGGDIPCELVPVVASINSLLRRVNAAIK